MKIELVFYDAGGGHRRAADALSEAICRQQRPWEVQCSSLQDVLDPLDIFRKLTGVRMQELYNLMLRKSLTLGARHLLRGMHALIRLYHRPAVRLLAEHFRDSRPHLVVSLIPHFNRALFEGLRQADSLTPFVTILTDIADYPPHFWIEPQPQYFICGSRRAVEQALAMGHPPEAVFQVSGMMLNPHFYEIARVDRRAERRRLGLDPDLPTALLCFGGHGSRLMRPIWQRLDRAAHPMQFIVICGRNQKLAERLAALPKRKPAHIVGFTREIPYYMQLSDFLIGKPGPGMISEAVLMKLPVIVISNHWTLPHERYNAEWVEQHQLGVAVGGLSELERAVTRLLEPERLEGFRAAAARLDNRAVFEVPDILAAILDRHARPPG